MPRLGDLARRLLGRAPAVLPEVIELVQDVARAARDRRDFRERLAQAARRGDLDEAFNRFAAANARARDYMDGGT